MKEGSKVEKKGEGIKIEGVLVKSVIPMNSVKFDGGEQTSFHSAMMNLVITFDRGVFTVKHAKREVEPVCFPLSNVRYWVPA